MAERQIGYRKSSLFLSAHFPVVKWRSRSVANVGDGDGDVNENGKKEIGIHYQNNNFARASRFFAHFFVVTALLRRETHPNFTFFGGCERKKTTFFLLFWTSILSFGIHLWEKIANIWRIERDGISAIKFEVIRIQFLVMFPYPSPSLLLKLPNVLWPTTPWPLPTSPSTSPGDSSSDCFCWVSCGIPKCKFGVFCFIWPKTSNLPQKRLCLTLLTLQIYKLE